MVNGNACGFNGIDQIQHAVHRVEVGRGLSDLRTDVAINALHLKPRQAGGALVGGQSAFVRHAKLVAFEAGGNVGVGFGVHVGIDANADGRSFAQALCHVAEHLELGFALDVEAGNARLQSFAHFSACFAYAREDDFRHIATCGDDAVEFASRHDVKAAAGLCKHLQHGE